MITAIYLLPALIRAALDYSIIEIDKVPVNYVISNSISALLIIFTSVTVFLVSDIMSLEDCFVAGIIIHFAEFDYVLNWFRGKPILRYYGDFTDKENLSWVEEHIYSKLSWQSLLIAKIILLIFGLWLLYDNGFNLNLISWIYKLILFTGWGS